MTKAPEGTSDGITADLAALRQDVTRLSESISALVQSQARGAAQHVADAVDDIDHNLVIGADAGNLHQGLFDLFGEEVDAFDDEHIIRSPGNRGDA